MPHKRHFSIDLFRGLAIVAMVFGNTSLAFKEGGFWATHAHDFGLTPGDLVAPMFIFAIGMTYKMSFEQGVVRDGRLNTYVKFLRRYAGLVGLGFLFHPVFPPTEEGIAFSWGVLAAIGVAGLLIIPLIRLPRWGRWMACVFVLVGYHGLLNASVTLPQGVMSVGELNWHDGHGGFIGGIGWFAMLLLSTALLDDARTQAYGKLWIMGLLTLVGGGVLHWAWDRHGLANGGISKERMTVAYVLVGVGASALLFSFLYWLADVKKWVTKSAFLVPFARNPFFIFIIHPFFVLAFYLALPKDSGDLIVGIASVANTALLWMLAKWMDSKRYYVNF